MTGKNRAKHTVSYRPFIHKFSLPPIRGTASRITIARLHIQKAPFMWVGLNMRDNSSPAENENNKRREPPSILSPVRENPTHISPYGPQIANAARPHPAIKTNKECAFVASLWMKSAYKMLPMYS